MSPSVWSGPAKASNCSSAALNDNICNSQDSGSFSKLYHIDEQNELAAPSMAELYGIGSKTPEPFKRRTAVIYDNIINLSNAEGTSAAMVTVVAYQKKGEHETNFRISMSDPLSIVMDGWRKEHNVPEEVRAVFTYHYKRVDPAATITSLGHDPSQGRMILRACPQKCSTEMSNAYSRYR